MPFAPHEIANKRFVVALRGYQTDEVAAFLRSVAADYEALLKEATENRRPEQLVAEIEHVMRSAREDAERAAAEIRAAAERDAEELREATQLEAEAYFDEIARQAEQLRALESALRQRVYALEHTMIEARQTLAHMSELHPMPTIEPERPSLPWESESYGFDDSVGTDTNFEAAAAAL